MKLSEKSRAMLALLDAEITELELLLSDYRVAQQVPSPIYTLLANGHAAAVAYRNSMRMVEALVDSREQQP